MLSNPPCIKYLVGCSDGNASGGDTSGSRGDSGGNSGTTGYGAGTSGAGGSFDTSGVGDGLSRYTSDAARRASSAGSNAANSLRDLQARLPGFASGSSILRKLKDSFAEYVLTVKNTGKDALSGVKVLHGPLPFGATFDPTKSAKECALNGKTVECILNLAPGESKDLLLTYKSSSSFSCAIAKILQSAKATLQNMTTGTVQSNPVVVSVRCSMRTVDRSDGDVASFNNVNVTQNSVGTGVSLDTTSNILVETGYKPYTNNVMPRTGAADYLLSSRKDYSFTILTKQQNDSNLAFIPIFVLSFISIFIIAILSKRAFLHK